MERREGEGRDGNKEGCKGKKGAEWGERVGKGEEWLDLDICEGAPSS